MIRKGILSLHILSTTIGLLMILLGINLTFAMGSKNRLDGQRLYFYSSKKLLSFLEEIGYPDYSFREYQDISRNSEGTELRFLNNQTKKALIVSCDGSIKEFDIPGHPAWFNDEHDIIAWHDRYKGLVFYKNGIKEKISASFNPNSGPDPSGRYFLKSPADLPPLPLNLSCSTGIYCIERPELLIAKVDTCGGRKIFVKNDRIFLFGNDYDVQHNTINPAITAYIFQIKGRKLVEIEKIVIPSPRPVPRIFVQDLSPWDDEVFLIDPHDFPGRYRRYVFNLNTHEMKKAGYVPFTGGRGFYLQCDIIKVVTEKLRTKN